MKKRHLIPFLALMAWLLTACGPHPVIQVEPLTFDFGQVVNGAIVRREVTIRNTGNAPLTIEEISTSCGCTTAAAADDLIPPGGSTSLEIVFDSGAHGPELTGPVLRQIFIVSDDPQSPEVVIEFTAEILPPE